MDKLQSNEINITGNKLPFYRKNADRNYWQEYIEASKTIYFNYNACREMESESVQDFGNRLIHFIETSPAEKLVIDLRNNTGGNSTLLDPFINAWKSAKKSIRPGNCLLYWDGIPFPLPY